jgi:hypothetical protein
MSLEEKNTRIGAKCSLLVYIDRASQPFFAMIALQNKMRLEKEG